MLPAVRKLVGLQTMVWQLAVVFAPGCGESKAPAAGDAVDASVDQGSADGAEEEVDAGPGSPVTGSHVNTRVSNNGRTMLTVDLSANRIGVWIGSGAQQRFIAGQGETDGTFSVPDVPAGPFRLVLADEKGDNPVIYASDGDVRTFDLGFEYYRYLAEPLPLAGDNTYLNLVLSGLSPWGPGDSLSLWSYLGIDYRITGQVFPAGSTTGMLKVPLDRSPIIDGPGRGHEVYLLQRGVSAMADGVQVQTFKAGVVSKALRTMQGQTTSVSETLQAFPADGVVAADVRRTQFLPFAPAGAAAGASISVSTSRAPTKLGELIRYNTSLVNAARGSADLRIDAREANPYPADWERVQDVQVGFAVATTLPATMQPLATSVAMSVLDRVDALLTGPIVPRLGPVRAVQIAGAAAEEVRTGVGFTPRVSWSPPALGQPTLYTLNIRRLEQTIEKINPVSVSTIYTGGTEVIVPPRLLQRGQWYQILIAAIAADAARPGAPHRSSFPRVRAEFLTGRFTP